MDGRNGKSDEQQIVGLILARLDTYNLSAFRVDDREDRKCEIARELVSLTKKYDHHIALAILMQATRHELLSGPKAHEIIMAGYHKEKHRGSPIYKNVKTVAFIKKYRLSDQEDVDDFLMDPERLLSWIDRAAPIEVSRLFDYFFCDGMGQRTEYYQNMERIAEKESRDSGYGKAFICLCIMHADPLKQVTVSHLKEALTALHQAEPGKYLNIIKMASIRFNTSHENSLRVGGSFVSLNKKNLTGIDFTSQAMQGARFNQAILDRSQLNAAKLDGAQLVKASLVSAKLNTASLTHTNLQYANLRDCLLANANLTAADLTGADLTNAILYRANLTKAVLKNTTLTGVEFFHDESFISVDTFSQECQRLNTMLSNHSHRPELLGAILNDLLYRVFNKKISDDLCIHVLQAAYEHSLFSEHNEHHLLKSTANVIGSNVLSATSSISSSIYSWFEKTPRTAVQQRIDDQLDIPLYETESQERLRQAIDILRLNQHQAARPAPPQTVPRLP